MRIPQETSVWSKVYLADQRVQRVQRKVRLGVTAVEVRYRLPWLFFLVSTHVLENVAFFYRSHNVCHPYHFDGGVMDVEKNQ